MKLGVTGGNAPDKGALYEKWEKGFASGKTVQAKLQACMHLTYMSKIT